METFSALLAINNWVNNREAGDLGRCRAHYDVAVMECRRNTITMINADLLLR